MMNSACRATNHLGESHHSRPPTRRFSVAVDTLDMNVPNVQFT